VDVIGHDADFYDACAVALGFSEEEWQ